MTKKEQPGATEEQQLDTIYAILETTATAYSLLFLEKPKEENPPAEEAEKTE